jgi:hypothetical protein
MKSSLSIKLFGFSDCLQGMYMGVSSMAAAVNWICHGLSLVPFVRMQTEGCERREFRAEN